MNTNVHDLLNNKPFNHFTIADLLFILDAHKQDQLAAFEEIDRLEKVCEHYLHVIKQYENLTAGDKVAGDAIIPIKPKD
jgi:hypothetical protein